MSYDNRESLTEFLQRTEEDSQRAFSLLLILIMLGALIFFVVITW